MNWLKQNWFKFSFLILAAITVVVCGAIQWRYYELEKYQTEQSAINWAIVENHASNIVGMKERQEFKDDFWSLFSH